MSPLSHAGMLQLLLYVFLCLFSLTLYHTSVAFTIDFSFLLYYRYEQAFLTTMLAGKQSYFWIGLNDLFQDGTFFWADSSPVKYTNWGAKQPRRTRWYHPDCVMMNTFGRWTNVNCYQTSGFVCETGWSKV